MVVGVMPPSVLMAFAPMEMEVLGAGEFNPFFSTADVSRIFPGSGMVRLNVSILIASLCPGICLVGECGFIQDCHHHNPRNKTGKDCFHGIGVGLAIHCALPDEELFVNLSWNCDKIRLVMNSFFLLYSFQYFFCWNQTPR